MNNDLSLSQSFGGLRIANPDGDEPGASRDVPMDPAMEDSSTSATSNVHGNTSPGPISTAQVPIETQTHSRRLSIFNLLRRTDASEDSSPSGRSPPVGSESPQESNSPMSNDAGVRSTDEPSKSSAPKAFRTSIPPNHQAQQQAQFQPYSTTPSTNGSRQPPAQNVSRPVSGVYAPTPPPGTFRARDHGYRVKAEAGQPAGGLARSNSRGATAMQAGVPSRETEHRDRLYANNPPQGGHAPPPRRSSKGMIAAHNESTSSGPGASYQEAEQSAVTSTEDWKDKGAAIGLREEVDEYGNRVLKKVQKGVRDFVFGQTLGEGSYSTVVLATDRQTLKEYAVKILDKKHIIKEKKVKYVNIEKDTLNRLIEHPGIVRLFYTFQDSNSLYYVLDIASGGELLGVLKKIGSFDVECTRFYGGQILCAIEHMHNRGVIHRDLKPENVLLDDQMHIKITDFGTAKLLHDPRKPLSDDESPESTRAKSFVGTAEYVSPELLTDKSACKASDLWAFGCIIYQLLAGRPPFKAGNEYQTFQKIVNLDYEFPPGFPPAARDLVERLLVLDPQMRLSMEHIKNHEFFDGLQISAKLWKTKAPRLKPHVPAAQQPNIIKLDGNTSEQAHNSTVRGESQQPPVAVNTSSNHKNNTSRPQPRVITELPPPTQLDIEWSPVLTRNNERILKLGNLLVLTSSITHSPNSKNGEEVHERKGLSRFFGGSTTKKRQRLVIVTSSARLIFAAAGGDEKKKKSELSLLDSDCHWRTQVDAKGQHVFCVDNVRLPFHYF